MKHARKKKWQLPGERPRSLSDLKKHPIVDSVSDERGSPRSFHYPADGIWVYLKPGWADEGETHCVHEWSVKELLDAFCDRVEPCRCEQCIQLEVPGTEEL